MDVSSEIWSWKWLALILFPMMEVMMIFVRQLQMNTRVTRPEMTIQILIHVAGNSVLFLFLKTSYIIHSTVRHLDVKSGAF